jgi:hypothetical protein
MDGRQPRSWPIMHQIRDFSGLRITQALSHGRTELQGCSQLCARAVPFAEPYFHQEFRRFNLAMAVMDLAWNILGSGELECDNFAW